MAQKCPPSYNFFFFGPVNIRVGRFEAILNLKALASSLVVTITQKGQSERFIRNRKKSRLKGSLFPPSPFDRQHRMSQCLPLMEQGGDSWSFPLDGMAWHCVEHRYCSGYIYCDIWGPAGQIHQNPILFKDINFISWMFEDVLEDRALQLWFIHGSYLG